MHETPPPGLPDFRPVTHAILRNALLRAGRDMRRAPLWGLALSAPWVAGGWLMAAITLTTGQSYWLVLAAVSFPLVAPFAAVGLYEVSRRLEQGRPLTAGAVLGVIAGQGRRQLPSLCAVILILFLFWFFLAHMIFALFLGLSTMTNVSSSAQVFLTGQGLAMLAVGTLTGGAFATLLYMITVIALPLLLDREVDFVTAMIASFTLVRGSAGVMALWALLIAALTFAALVPAFLGLFLALPLLGHATWHLYDQVALRDPQ